MIALALLEAGAVIGALLAGLFLQAGLSARALHQLFSSSAVEVGIVLFSGLLALGMGAMGLFQTQMRETVIGVTLRTLVSFLAAAALVGLVVWLVPGTYPGDTALVYGLSGAFFSAVAVHRLFFLLLDAGLFKTRLLVLGTGQSAQALVGLRRRADRRGFQLVGFIQLDGAAACDLPAPVIRHDVSLAELARRHRASELLVAIDERRGALPNDELLACRLDGVRVVDGASFFEREMGKIRLDLLHPSWLIYNHGYNNGALGLLVKRCFDVAVSLLFLLAAWPLMVITAMAICREEGWRGPVFYTQVRTGKGGAPFRLIKFRSMRVNAERAGEPVWADKHDSRVTRVGAFIRKTRIDELPQLFNVLKGEMSFVGPRPERPEFVERLAREIPYYNERHRIKPGLTGWAQLRYPYGASKEDAVEKLQYDLYYLKNRSLLFDLLILLQTVEVVLFGKGAR